MHPWAVGFEECLKDLVTDTDTTEGEIAGGHRFGELHDVRLDAPMVQREQEFPCARSL